MKKGVLRMMVGLFLPKDRNEIEPAMIEVLRNLRLATSGVRMATSVAEDTRHHRRDQGQSQSKTVIGSYSYYLEFRVLQSNS